MSQKHSIRTIGFGALWSVLNNSAAQGLSLLIFLVTARFVSLEDFGVMAASFLVVEGFRQIVLHSIGTALMAERSPDDADYNACFWLIAALGVLLAAIIYVLAGPIANLLGVEKMEHALRALCPILLTTGLSKTHEVWLSKELRFKALALRSIGSLILGGGIGIYMAMRGHGLDALIVQQLVTALSAAALLWLATPWRPGFRTGRDNVARLLRDSKHLIISGGTSFAMVQSDTFFASAYLGAAATGLYNAAKRIITALNIMLSSALNAVAFPVLASIDRNDERMKTTFLKTVSMTCLATAPLFAGLFAMAEELVFILLGSKWENAAPVLAILSASGFILTLGQYNANIMVIYKKAQWQTAINIASAAINIALFILVARYGLMALSIAFVGRALLMYPIATHLCLRLMNVRWLSYLRAVTGPVLASVFMGGIIVWAKSTTGFSPIINLLIYVPCGVVLYAALLAVFDFGKVREIKDIFHKIRS